FPTRRSSDLDSAISGSRSVTPGAGIGMESVGGFECSGTTPPINYGAKFTYGHGKDRKVGFVHHERPAQGLQRTPAHLAARGEPRLEIDGGEACAGLLHDDADEIGEHGVQVLPQRGTGEG